MARRAHKGVWDAIEAGDFFTQVIQSLISVSTYWITWLLQRNLGAAVDLAQLVNLAWGTLLIRRGRRLRSPALAADGQHLMTDVWTSVGVIAATYVVFATGLQMYGGVTGIQNCGQVGCTDARR